jgi:hypothetical protein
MKTRRQIYLLIVYLFGWAITGYSQGSVTFNNGGTTLISTNFNPGAPPSGPTSTNLNSYVYALFVAPSTVTTVSGVTDTNWLFTGAYATNTTTPGRLVGGVATLPSGYASGTTASFLIRGWSTSIAGKDWPAVQASIHKREICGCVWGSFFNFFGVSSIATLVVGGNPLPNGVLFGTTPGASIQGFSLNMPIPCDGADQASVSLGAGQVTGSQIHLDFYVLCRPATDFKLLQSDKIGGPWTTNETAVLATVVAGEYYYFTAQLDTNQHQFYRIKAKSAN